MLALESDVGARRAFVYPRVGIGYPPRTDRAIRPALLAVERTRSRCPCDTDKARLPEMRHVQCRPLRSLTLFWRLDDVKTATV